METFFGLERVKVVDFDASPAGCKLNVIWNPPHRDPKNDESPKCSVVEETVHLILYLMFKGVRTICFVKVFVVDLNEIDTQRM